MGIKMPGATSGLFDPKVVESLIEAEKIPVETAKKRRESIVKEKEEVQKLITAVSDLDTALNGLKTKGDFYRMKVESSHPDIIDGSVEGITLTGSYEFEVRGLAKAEKELAYGFPDKDETPVGFGYMLIEREDMDPLEVTVEPGSTLDQVATAINEQDAGVKAMVINTKYKPDPYRLLVVSEKSGQEAKILIDEDTTFLEFKEQVTGRNLDILFEDVPVTDEDNTLEELVDNVVFFAKRSEPGTRVQVNIVHDLDATLEGIKEFVTKYNDLANFIHEQFQVDPETKRAGLLSGDHSIKAVQRRLQGSLGGFAIEGSKYRTLADIGITTDPKSGSLNFDEAKVRQALAEDYDGVANLFINSRNGSGVAERMGEAIKGLKDPDRGVLRARMRGLETVIKNQDQDIKRRERAMEQKEDSIRRRFSALEGQLADLRSQGDFLAAKFAGGGGAAKKN